MATKKPTLTVAPGALFALLGATLEAPETQAVIAASGKVKTQKPGREGFYVFAKDAGYALAFRPLLGAPRTAPHVLDSVTLYAEGSDGFRGFTFPLGLSAGMLATDVRQKFGPPLADDANHTLLRFGNDHEGVAALFHDASAPARDLYVDVVYTTGNVAGIDVQGDYSVARVLDLRVRAHELEWERRKRAM